MTQAPLVDIDIGPSQPAIYEQRRGNRSRFFDARVVTIKNNGLVKINWRDHEGNIRVSNVPRRFVRLAG